MSRLKVRTPRQVPVALNFGVRQWQISLDVRVASVVVFGD